MEKNLSSRVLLYSADNAGIGHSSIGVSLLSSLRDANQSLEVLVISSTGVPQRFLQSGIEVIKIPSLEPCAVDLASSLPYQPRYLTRSSVRTCMFLRQEIIDAVFIAYAPSVVFVDHHITGLNGELIPWLLKKQMGYVHYKCAYLSRGIIAGNLVIAPPFEHNMRGIRTIDLSDSFERFFVFEDRAHLGEAFFSLSQVPHIQHKTEYLGMIAQRNRNELLSKEQVWHLLGLPPRKLILVSSGHGAKSREVIKCAVASFTRLGLSKTHVLLITTSPYLTRSELMELRNKYTTPHVIVSDFFDYFLDAMNYSDLTVCRAGYNTIAELMLTGCSAVVIPEDYGSREQTARASLLPETGFQILRPDEINVDSMSSAIQHLFSTPRRQPLNHDRVQTARRIASWIAS